MDYTSNSTQLVAIGVVAVLVVAGAAFILVNHNDERYGLCPTTGSVMKGEMDADVTR